MLLLTILAASLLTPLAAAQEGDPLLISYYGFLTAEGNVTEPLPAAGAYPLPATPLAPADARVAATFTWRAPVAFAPSASFEVALTLRADQAVVARDAEGNALELRVEPEGAPVRVAFEEDVMAPGTIARVVVSVPAPARAFAEGEEIVLRVTPLMPGLAEGALSIVVGGESASRFDAPGMRVPSPAALRLQDVPHTEFLLGVDRFEPPAGHAVNVYVVGHDSVQAPAQTSFSANGTYVVFHGVEDAMAGEHQHASREARVAAAHEFSVNGILARVHPGLGVVVRAPIQPVIVQCIRNCPAEGFQDVLGGRGEGGAAGEAPSALVPPPRDTSGIPVSGDEPPAADAPLGVALAALALGLAARAKR